MSTKNSDNKELLLEMKGLMIEGFSDEEWHQIVKGVDVTLHRGEVLGLIGECGAGKSTIGIAAMGYAKPGCRINGGSILFDGVDLVTDLLHNAPGLVIVVTSRERLHLHQEQPRRKRLLLYRRSRSFRIYK